MKDNLLSRLKRCDERYYRYTEENGVADWHVSCDGKPWSSKLKVVMFLCTDHGVKRFGARTPALPRLHQPPAKCVTVSLAGLPNCPPPSHPSIHVALRIQLSQASLSTPLLSRLCQQQLASSRPSYSFVLRWRCLLFCPRCCFHPHHRHS